MLLEILSITALFLLCFYLHRRWKLSYWTRRGLESFEPNYMDQGQQYFDSYFHFKKKGVKHGGTYLFSQPHYIPVDLDLIKKIISSDFDYFPNRGFVEYKGEENFLNCHLIYLEDHHWKNLRSKLSPCLSSGMYNLLYLI